VEVLNDDQQRLDLAFPEQEPFYRIQRPSTPLGGSSGDHSSSAAFDVRMRCA
jgi:hypothetical protein